MEWYLSDQTTEDFALLGLQQPNVWTCPVLGIERVQLTQAQAEVLEERGIKVAGNDVHGIYIVHDTTWQRITGNDESEEWGHLSDHQVIIATDVDQEVDGEPLYTVLRLSLAFE